MKEITALKSILFVSLLGVLFSGYLSISEIFANSCQFGCGKIADVPICVYGFVMFALIFAISLQAVLKKK